MTRKAVQLIIWGDRLVALCSDGTMWADPDAGWNKIEAIPGSDDDPHMNEVESAPCVDPDWPPVFLQRSKLRLFASDRGFLTELTDSNGLILAARTDCTIIETIHGTEALEIVARDFALCSKNSGIHKGISFSYWSDTIPF